MAQYEKMYLISEADYLASRNIEPAQLPETESSVSFLHRTPQDTMPSYIDKLPMFESSRLQSTPIKRIPPRVLATETIPIQSPDTTLEYENENDVEILNNSTDDAKIKLKHARQLYLQNHPISVEKTRERALRLLLLKRAKKSARSKSILLKLINI